MQPHSLGSNLDKFTQKKTLILMDSRETNQKLWYTTTTTDHEWLRMDECLIINYNGSLTVDVSTHTNIENLNSERVFRV